MPYTNVELLCEILDPFHTYRHSLGGSDIGSPQQGSGGGEYHSSQGDSHGFRGLAPSVANSPYGSYNSPSNSWGTTHRIYMYIGKEEEEKWGGTHQVLMNRGKEGRLVVVGMGLLVLVVGVKVHGAMVVVVGMMNSGRINSLHGEDKVVS